MSRLSALLTFVLATPLSAAEPFRYPEGRHGQAELKYINGLPVIRLQGKPEEIGVQMAMLTARPAQKLLNYPKDVLKHLGLQATWPALVATGKGMLANFPADYRRELEAGIKAAELDRELFIAANTMFDIKKLFACSSLIVEPEKSATGGLLFGRNLDFPTLGYLHEYSMVIVCHPEGKRAFASVGFPGVIGVLSGINDAGLALAVHEVYHSNDDSVRFDPQGTPYALCFRRILEECTTVEEAEKLLKSMRRTTRLNLAVADRKRGAVFEFTPKQVVVRSAADGYCACTNHFRSKELSTWLDCGRFRRLDQARDEGKLAVADLGRKLHQVHQGQGTLQTMVFEPVALKLHLAIGEPPTTALPLKTLDLKPLLEMN